ncbi:putative PurR-regulated permease PerM [Microbacterium sp. SORGH_AS454]|nr:putative PurR-regulated permease PerM [Microbacterium sp. SORGH_AS_0454]
MTNATTAQTNLTLHTIPTGGSGATESTFQTIRGCLKVLGKARRALGRLSAQYPDDTGAPARLMRESFGMKIHNPFRVALLATLGVGVGLLLIGSVQNLSTILLYVGTALFLSLGLDPVVSFLERRGLPRWAAVLVTILAVLGVFAGIIFMVVPIIVSQIAQLVTQIEQLLQPGRWNEIVTDVQTWVSQTLPWLKIDEVWAGIQHWFSTLDVGSISTMIGNSLLTIGGAVAAGLGGAFIVLILTIYFTASTPSLKSAVYQLVPASKRARFIELAEKITDSVGYYVMGQVSLGVINGVLSAIFLSIINAPFPAVLAVIAFFFSLIPLVGTLTGSTIIVPDLPHPRPRHTHLGDRGRGDLLPRLHADRGVRDLPAHHEPRRVGAGVGRGHLGTGRRRAAEPAGRAHRDPGGGEHPHHLPRGHHPATERALILSPRARRPTRWATAGRRGSPQRRSRSARGASASRRPTDACRRRLR